MARITKDEIDVRVNWYNQHNTSDATIKLSRRNGYYALDLYSNGKMLRAIRTGTARECYDYMCGVMFAMDNP